MNRSSREFTHDLFSQFARIGKALSNANRLELLELLAQGERSVESVANLADLTIANTSQHLQQLRQAGLVTSRKVGQQVYYRLNGDDVVDLLDVLHQVAEHHLAEVEKLIHTYLSVKDTLEPVRANELLDRARSGDVIILDVRPREEFAAGHVPGAINIPLEELEKHLDDLPKDREIIAYCRGAYCVLAYDAVAELREKGFMARRLLEGYPQWKRTGLPVDEARSE